MLPELKEPVFRSFLLTIGDAMAEGVEAASEAWKTIRKPIEKSRHPTIDEWELLNQQLHMIAEERAGTEIVDLTEVL